MHKPKKIILCGGGTGGHIFPAISIDSISRSDSLLIKEIIF